jgi:hypothetical protein
MAIKLFNNIKYMFIDATFKTSPRNCYQTLNIMGYIEEASTPIPLLFIPMTNESYECYDKIFISFKSLLESLNIKVNFIKLIIVADYE